MSETNTVDPVDVSPEAPKEEKKSLRRFYKKMTCKVCGGVSVYMPNYNKPACPKCMKLDLSIKSDNPEDYLTESFKKASRINKKESRFALRMQDPRSDPLYGMPGRNEDCVCGSGLKFKKCCMGEFISRREEVAAAMADTVRENFIIDSANEMKVLVDVISHQQANNWEEISTDELKIELFPRKDIPDSIKEKTAPLPEKK